MSKTDKVPTNDKHDSDLTNEIIRKQDNIERYRREVSIWICRTNGIQWWSLR